MTETTRDITVAHSIRDVLSRINSALTDAEIHAGRIQEAVMDRNVSCPEEATAKEPTQSFLPGVNTRLFEFENRIDSLRKQLAMLAGELSLPDDNPQVPLSGGIAIKSDSESLRR